MKGAFDRSPFKRPFDRVFEERPPSNHYRAPFRPSVTYLRYLVLIRYFFMLFLHVLFSELNDSKNEVFSKSYISQVYHYFIQVNSHNKCISFITVRI